jgi:OHCU decarboxylase
MDEIAANARITIATLNEMTREQFAAAIGTVLEDSAHLVARAWDARPFGSLADLHVAIMDAVSAATPQEKLALLQAHPDLGDRLSRVSIESTKEQAKAGLNELTPEEVAQFRHLNAEYRQRYGFPFIICARLNSKRTILANFARRLRKPREVEFATALAQVAKIARLRLADLVAE